MFKKIFYSLTILAMLFGMFGVMGTGGVQPAKAAEAAATDARAGVVVLPDDGADADPFNDSYYYLFAVAPGFMSTVTPAVGDPIGCSIGANTAWVRVPAALVQPSLEQPISTLHIHAQAATLIAAPNTPDVLVIAAYIANADGTLGTRLGCDDSLADGLLDLVVQVPANTVVDVLIANNILAAPPAAVVAGGALWIMRGSDPAGGLIIAGLPGAATTTSVKIGTEDASTNDVDGNAWFGNVPAGTYLEGISRSVVVAGVSPFAYTYTVVVPGFQTYAADPTASIVDFAVNGVRNTAGGILAYSAHFMPFDGGFTTNMAITGGGAATVVRVTPRVWDIGVTADIAAGADYFMVVRNVGITAGSTYAADLRANVSTPQRVRMCTPNLYNVGVTRYDPEGALTSVTMNFDTGTAVCPAGYKGGEVFLTAGIPFAIRAQLTENTTQVWDYFVVPSNSPWNFAAGIATPAYTARFGQWYDALPLGDGDGVRDAAELTFLTTAGTSEEDYTAPVASVAMTRGNFVDANGNTLVRVRATDNLELSCLDVNGNGAYDDLILDDDDEGGTAGIDGAFGWEDDDEIAPCDRLQTVGFFATQLANDYAITDLSTTGLIGRYRHTRTIQTGPAADWVLAGTVNDLFAVSPNDTSMLGHWAWSWVEALYELGYTSGIGGNAYGPDQTMTRAQMAVFLSRVLSDNSSIPVAGAGVGGVFTDVPAAFWAGGAIEQLEDLGITSGIGGGLYAPNNPVTRAEMAKFIQLTFRTARLYGWTGCDLNLDGTCNSFTWWGLYLDLWDPSQNVLAPGSTFIDVPAGHWANLWIEEMNFDGLTSGCTYGVYDPGVRYFCPADDVTRGQMAKFILTALQTDGATRGFWPVLAPER